MGANQEVSTHSPKHKMDEPITTKAIAKSGLWQAFDRFSKAWSDVREHLDGYHERLRLFGLALQDPEFPWSEHEEALLEEEGNFLIKKEQFLRETAVEVLQ